MFDNEIDWVMRIVHSSLVPGARKGSWKGVCMNDAIQGRAHAMGCRETIQAKCSM